MFESAPPTVITSPTSVINATKESTPVLKSVNNSKGSRSVQAPAQKKKDKPASSSATRSSSSTNPKKKPKKKATCETTEETNDSSTSAKKPTTIEVLEKCVVKRCLFSAISDGLSDEQHQQFLEYIEECVDIASRIARRVSLAFLYYIAKRQTLGLPIPDFSLGTDGYFIAWMRLGLDEYADKDGNKTYPILTPSKKTEKKYGKNFVIQDESSRAIDRQIFSEIEVILGTTVGGTLENPIKRTIPKFFDRILGHLAIQFSTAIENAMTVNFFAKLKRLCKNEVRVSNIKDFNSYDLLKAICKNNVVKETPDHFDEVIEDIRDALGVEESFVIYEDTPFEFPERFKVHWVMQQKFAKLGAKKMMLSPVHQVQRIHIRLDATSLSLIRNDIHMAPFRKIRDDLHPGTGPTYPKSESHPDPKELKIARGEYRILKNAHDDAMEEWRKANDKCKKESFFNFKNPPNPYTKMNEEIPVPSAKIPVGMDKKSKEWITKRDQLRTEIDEARRLRSERRETPEFQKEKQEYDDYELKVHKFGLSLFKNFRDRNPKLGWKLSGSVMVDGVSLSMDYERITTKTIDTCKEKSDAATAKNKEMKDARDAARELEPYDDYDPDDSTCFGDRLILGIDPGRVCLVTIICIEKDGTRTTWRLLRGQYHTESGILGQNKMQQKRYEMLVPSFATLTADGGALRASTVDEIVKYIAAYKKFDDLWFTEVALKQVESWAKLKRYSGKQRTLASFFSKVRTDAEKICKSNGLKSIDVAYGACGPTMASSGRGELAVPTTGTYKACVRAFTKERKGDKMRGNSVSVENEDYTSKRCYDNGLDWEHVYKIHDPNGKEYLQHSTSKNPPAVKESFLLNIFQKEGAVESVTRRKAELKLKAKIRRSSLAAVKKEMERGGRSYYYGEQGIVEPRSAVVQIPQTSNNVDDARKVHHIIVRGLLFCPERCMYFDRDEQSARAIAGLRCIKLSGRGRPTAFRRPVGPVHGEQTTIVGAVEKAKESSPDRVRSSRLTNAAPAIITP